MRTTVTLDDALLGQLKRKAAERDTSLSRLIENLLRLGLAREAEAEAADAEPFEFITFGKGGSFSPYNIDKTSELIGLEDLERYGCPETKLDATG